MIRKLKSRQAKRKAAKWAKTRTLGKQRYKIIYGIIYFGIQYMILSCILLSALMLVFSLPLIFVVLVFIVINLHVPYTGYIVASRSWDIMETWYHDYHMETWPHNDYAE